MESGAGVLFRRRPSSSCFEQSPTSRALWRSRSLAKRKRGGAGRKFCPFDYWRRALFMSPIALPVRRRVYAPRATALRACLHTRTLIRRPRTVPHLQPQPPATIPHLHHSTINGFSQHTAQRRLTARAFAAFCTTTEKAATTYLRGRFNGLGYAFSRSASSTSPVSRCLRRAYPSTLPAFCLPDWAYAVTFVPKPWTN